MAPPRGGAPPRTNHPVLSRACCFIFHRVFLRLYISGRTLRHLINLVLAKKLVNPPLNCGVYNRVTSAIIVAVYPELLQEDALILPQVFFFFSRTSKGTDLCNASLCSFHHLISFKSFRSCLWWR